MAAELLDSTLREGELYRIFPLETKVRLAKKLVAAGIKRIEFTIDYPPRTTYEDNMTVIRELTGSDVLVVMHGRALPEDIQTMKRYAVNGCAFYIAISKLHREYKLHGITVQQVVERLASATEMARQSGFKYIRVTLEDATRAFREEGGEGLETLRYAIDEVRKHGATQVSLPDTSGLLPPRLAGEFFRRMKELSSLPLSAHFHNDYGFASANTVEAALEGADELHVSVLGIGDRNGIADLYQVAATLEDIHGIKTGINRSSLRELYNDFSRLTGISIPWLHPLSDEARTIRAGVHQSMTVKRKEGYIPPRKLIHDFDRPLYMLSPYVSHKLVQEILSPHIKNLDPRTAREIVEALAASSQGLGHSHQLHELRRIVKDKVGIELPHEELARYFGRETIYILLKLDPRFQADEVVREVRSWDGVESADEVYGDVDMIIKARVNHSKDNLLRKLRQRFSDVIQDLRVLVTD